MPDVQPCHLLRLPRELCLIVYARVLNETITVHEPSASNVATRHLADAPGTVLASKRVHHGSIALFHATATFCFECIIHAVHWMHTILRACSGAVVTSRNTIGMSARLLLGRELEAVLQSEQSWLRKEANNLVLGGDVFHVEARHLEPAWGA